MQLFQQRLLLHTSWKNGETWNNYISWHVLNAWLLFFFFNLEVGWPRRTKSETINLQNLQPGNVHLSPCPNRLTSCVFITQMSLINPSPLITAMCFSSLPCPPCVIQMFNHWSVSLYNIGLHSKKQMGDGHVGGKTRWVFHLLLFTTSYLFIDAKFCLITSLVCVLSFHHVIQNLFHMLSVLHWQMGC